MNQPLFTVTSSTTSIQQNESFAPIKKIHFQAMILTMVLSLFYVTYETKWANHQTLELAPTKEKVDLIFKDGMHGEIIIGVVNKEKDPSSIVHEITVDGEQGFLRGTLRALARERKNRQLSPYVAFELKLDTDGRLSITDPLTSSMINLDAFGPDNVAVFLNIMNESKKSLMAQESIKKSDEHSKEMK